MYLCFSCTDYYYFFFKKKDGIWDTAAILSQKADTAVLLVLPVACWALAAGRQRCFCISSESVWEGTR